MKGLPTMSQTKSSGDTAVNNAVNGLLKIVQNYESDTFSAEGSKMTNRQARLVVARLIRNIGDPTGHLDGVTLSSTLDEIRGL